MSSHLSPVSVATGRLRGRTTAPTSSRSTTLRYHAVGAQKCTATSRTWLRCRSLQSSRPLNHPFCLACRPARRLRSAQATPWLSHGSPQGPCRCDVVAASGKSGGRGQLERGGRSVSPAQRPSMGWDNVNSWSGKHRTHLVTKTWLPDALLRSCPSPRARSARGAGCPTPSCDHYDLSKT